MVMCRTNIAGDSLFQPKHSQSEETVKTPRTELQPYEVTPTTMVHEANERLRNMSSRLTDVRDVESSALTRDVHNEIEHILLLITLALRENRNQDGTPELSPNEPPIADSFYLLDQVRQQLHSLSSQLKNDKISTIGPGAMQGSANG